MALLYGFNCWIRFYWFFRAACALTAARPGPSTEKLSLSAVGCGWAAAALAAAAEIANQQAYYRVGNPDKHTPKYKVSSACPNHLHNYYTTQNMQEVGFTPNAASQKREKRPKSITINQDGILKVYKPSFSLKLFCIIIHFSYNLVLFFLVVLNSSWISYKCYRKLYSEFMHFVWSDVS